MWLTKRSSAAAAAMVTLAVMGLSGPAGAQPTSPLDWSTFGHDLSNTRTATEYQINPGNVSGLTQKWSAAGAGVTSTPAVVGGIVYYSDFAGNLLARVASTGTLVWETNLEPGGQLPGSPAVTGTSVYIAGAGGFVFAVNRWTGAPQWSTQIEPTPNALAWSSPTIIGNTMIIGSGSYQVFSPASPVFQGSVVGLDSSTGAIKWRTPVCTGTCTGVSVWSSAAVDPTLGLAYIGTGQSYTPPAGPMSDSLIALNYTTGKIAWTQQYTAGDVYSSGYPNGLDHDLGDAPNLFTINGRTAVGCGDKGGSYRVFDAATGKPIWADYLVKGTELGGIEETTAYDNGTIYALGNTQETATSRADARPTAATLFALNATNGTIRWQVNLPAGGFGGIAIANGVLYFNTWDGTLRAHSAATGATLLTTYVGDPDNSGVVEKGAAGGPSISNGMVYDGYGWTWGATVNGGIRAFGLY